MASPLSQLNQAQLNQAQLNQVQGVRDYAIVVVITIWLALQ